MSAQREIGGPRAEPEEPGEVSLLAVVNVLLRHRGLVIGTAFVLALIACAVTFMAPRTYTSQATLTPQTSLFFWLK